GRPEAIIATAIGGAIAGLLYGGLVGSFSGLESPDPGNEPTDSEHPLAEPPTEEEDEPRNRSRPTDA
ncbi:MAG: hypothetical protein ACRELC_07295, partial [Gemmatimonadota bacterium]